MSPQIGGNDVVVQIDESHIFTRKYHRGRDLVSEQFWTFGGIDDDGNIFLERILDRKSETLTEVLQRRVKPGSIILSDQWSGYSLVGDFFLHFQVNHSENFVNPVTGVDTQRIEATWSVLKRLLRKKGVRKCENLDFYLAEFIFRMKNKPTPFGSFLSLIKNIMILRGLDEDILCLS